MGPGKPAKLDDSGPVHGVLVHIFCDLGTFIVVF